MVVLNAANPVATSTKATMKNLDFISKPGLGKDQAILINGLKINK
jgi:hypothetical protein